MSAVPLADIVTFLDEYLRVDQTPDYPQAFNGLQVEGPDTVTQFAVAVDASQEVIDAVGEWADLLIVHHGLFWGGLRPLSGPYYQRIAGLVRTSTALYSSHLPLDSHAEVGNAAIMARELGVKGLEPFGEYDGAPVGWKGRLHLPAEELKQRLEDLLKGPVQILPGGPDMIQNLGIVTGSGASSLPEASRDGLDAIITGEAQHHHALDARELGVSAFLGGHYATETFGVNALASLLRDRFHIEGLFIDSPSGL